ncbi:MAG: hypothetical protein WA958_06755, partial [Tunicatimonas sp.]
MKKVNLITLPIILSCCTTINRAAFVEKSFKTKSDHMMGISTIEFKTDSLFYLTDRNGSLYSEGIWQLEKDRIIISSFSPNTRFTGDTSAIYFEATDEEIMVKN